MKRRGATCIARVEREEAGGEERGDERVGEDGGEEGLGVGGDEEVEWVRGEEALVADGGTVRGRERRERDQESVCDDSELQVVM